MGATNPLQSFTFTSLFAPASASLFIGLAMPDVEGNEFYFADVPAPSANVAVPEPATVTLLMLGFAIGGARRRRKLRDTKRPETEYRRETNGTGSCRLRFCEGF